ncbi:MAG: lipopolysaccharide biosynthesis protein [Solirubrobacteraceae bacterium]
MSDKTTGIATRTLRGMAWAYGAYVGGKGLTLVSTAILARLLLPREFGVVALALTLTLFLEALKDLGLSQALIVSTDEEEQVRAQTVFSWSVVFGVVLTALTAAIGVPAAHFFHQPELEGIVPLIGLGFTFNALGTTHYALARRRLNYRARTVCEITEAAVRGILSISLALAGFGAWSLALGYVVSVAASTVAAWIMIDFRPRLALGRTHLRDLLSFGGVLTLVDLGAVIFYNADYLFIGRVLGAASLGLYTLGFRLPELAVLNIAHVAGDVLFPSYSALRQGRLREGFLTATKYLTMLLAPVAVGIAVLAHPLVLVVFGSHWTRSVPVTRAITLYAFFAALAIPPGTVLKVTRRARLMVLFSLPVLAAMIVLLALFTSEGIVTVALMTTALEMTIAPMQYAVVSRQLNVTARELLGSFAAPAVACAVMAAGLGVVLLVVPGALGELLAGIAVGATIYLSLLWLLAGHDLKALRTIALPRS